jgi:hypothetical protein
MERNYLHIGSNDAGEFEVASEFRRCVDNCRARLEGKSIGRLRAPKSPALGLRSWLIAVSSSPIRVLRTTYCLAALRGSPVPS